MTFDDVKAPAVLECQFSDEVNGVPTDSTARVGVVLDDKEPVSSLQLES